MEEQSQTIATEDDCVGEDPKTSRGVSRSLRRRKKREDRQLKIRLEATFYDKKFLASQALYRKKVSISPRCALCGKCKIIEDHTATRRHVTSLSRFREIFEVRGTLAFCVGCNSPVDWPDVKGHLESHRVLPWYRPENVYGRLFSQGTWHPPKYFYCWACEALTANWWEAYEHCDLESHLLRVQGQTGWTIKDKACKQWVVKGYSPGEDGKLECRLCGVSLEIEDPTMHWRSAEHKMNAKRAARDLLRIGESGGLEQRCTETPSCEDSAQSCEDLTQSCEDLTPFCEELTPFCEELTPSCESATPFCENATPSCESAAPSCENATPSCENAKPSCQSARPFYENATPSCENAAPSCENATLSCKNATPSCENATPSCENATLSCKNATPSCENATPSCKNATPSCENAKPSCKNATPSCGHSAPSFEDSPPSCVSDKPSRTSASLFKRATPSCKNAAPSSENATPSCENATPSYENAAPSCKNAKPSCENASPSCKNATPSCENASPSCENATPSCQNAAPSHENATPSCGHSAPSFADSSPSCVSDKPSRTSASLFKRATPSCKNAAPSCTNAAPSSENATPSCENAAPSSENATPSSENATPSCNIATPSCDDSAPSCEKPAPSCARTNTKAKRRRRHKISLDSPNDLDASTFDALTFLIGPHTLKLEETLRDKFVPERSQACAFYCVICADPISDVKAAQNHVSGRLHEVSMKKYACESIVSTPNGYRCKCCDRKMNLLSLVYRHVLENEHSMNYASGKYDEMVLREADDEAAPLRENSTPSCDRSETAKKNVSSSSRDDKSFVAGECLSRKDGVSTPSRDSSENSTPSCQRSSTLSKRPNEIAHDSISEDSKSLDEPEVRFLEDLTFLIGPQMAKLGKCLKEKLATAGSLGCKLYCVICDAPISNFQNAREHVSGRRHASSTKKNRCEDISELEGGYYCKCCDHKMKHLSVVYHHVSSPRHTCHLENWSANDEEVPVSAPIIATECSTRKAGVETPSREDSRDSSENSTPSCQRSSTLSKRPNEIAHDSISEDSKSLDEPEARFLEDLTFLIGPQMAKLGKCLKEKLATAGSLGCKLYCVICEAPISNFQNAREHVSGRRHASSTKKNRCEDISELEGGYYCKCCDHKMKHLSVVYHHVSSPRHTCHLENWSANDEKVPVSAPIIATECSTRKAGVETPSREDSRDSSENSTPSCQRSSTLSKRPNEIAHDSISEDSKSLDEPEARFLEDLTFLIGPQMAKLGKCLKEKLATAGSLGCKLYCVICDAPISNFQNAREHVSGRRHASSTKKNRCEDISELEGGYYCKCCDHKMKHLSVVYHHVSSPRHTCHLENWSANDEKVPVSAPIIAAECSTKKAGVETPSREDSRDSSENSTPSCQRSSTLSKRPNEIAHDSISEDSKSLDEPEARFLEDLTFLIGPQMAKLGKCLKEKLATAGSLGCKLYCVICDAPISNFQNAREHVSGRRHASSTKKNRCEDISELEGGYYCKCCDHKMKHLSVVYHHVSSPRHTCHLENWSANDEKVPVSAPIIATECSTRKAGVETPSREDSRDSSENSTPSCQRSSTLSKRPNEIPHDSINLEECSATKSVSETPFCSAKSTPFSENTTPSCDASSLTSVNSTPSRKISVATPPELSYDRINRVNTNDRTCHICWPRPRGIGNVHEHVSGSRHQQSLDKLRDAAPQQNGGPKNDLTKSSSSNLDNESVESFFTRNYEDASSCFKVKRETEKPETSVRPETETAPSNSLYDYIALKMAASTMETLPDEPNENEKTEKIDTNDASRKKPRSFVTRPIRIKCSMCAKLVPDRKSLHSHLASHFSDYFVSAVASKDSSLVETSIFELDDCTFEDEGLSPLPEFIIASDETRKRNVNVRKTLKLLDFNGDAIYEMIDKIAEYELCSKLCLIVDESTIYCLVCREPLTNTLRSFHDHLKSLDHCSYLEIMENDAGLYAGYVDQFSDLDLAHEYMEDWNDETVRCYACVASIANETLALRAHIYEAGHSEARKALRIGAARISELLVPRANCDWYGVQLYWCVACHIRCENEFTFVAHLESPEHSKRTKKLVAKGKTMLLDYCQSCALLWYGYRVTRFYHEETSAHVVLARDGYYATRSLSKFAMGLLTKPEVYADARIQRCEELEIDEASKQRDLLEELEDIARKKFPNAKAYTFGSRIAGLSSENSDIDVYLDCQNTYDGNEPESVTSYFIKGVYDCLCNYPNSWDVDELLSTCRAPIIRAHHRETDLKCDLSFQNGLGVENTKMIRAYCTVYPPCRKLIIILRQWLAYCNLADPNIVKNYCLSWLVIFYLQSILVLPSVATLIKMRNKSRKIAGWEVGVSHEFGCYEAHLGADDSSPIVRLLKGFFSFYADFDFRREVVCPLLGYSILKRDFIVSKNLPDSMKPYKQHVAINRKTEIFAMDKPMCVQDPFRMNDNLATSVGKRHLNAFRVFCAESLNFISSL